MSEEEAYLTAAARNAALYHHYQDPAAREAMENYMMYFSRMSGFDPMPMPTYPMMAAQMPFLLQPAKENTASKVHDERANFPALELSSTNKVSLV